jgi:hypothetical protein
MQLRLPHIWSLISATGRFVVLYDEQKTEIWSAPLRVVSYTEADLAPEYINSTLPAQMNSSTALTSTFRKLEDSQFQERLRPP